MGNLVIIYKTSIGNKGEFDIVKKALFQYLPNLVSVTVDLEDHDKVLRVEGDRDNLEQVDMIIQQHIIGTSIMELFFCEKMK